MAKFQSPLLGYNNNVRHKNRVFHIQTEDSGVNHPHIITHLFMDGGRILKSVKKSYAEHVGADGMSDTVRNMMKEQHKAMFIALRDGQFDHLVDYGNAPAAPAAPAATASEATKTAPNPPPSEPSAPSTNPEQAPATIDESRRIAALAAAAAPVSAPAVRIPSVSMPVSEQVPTTMRDAAPPSAARSQKEPGPALTLDFDALESVSGDDGSLFRANDLPPPPKNLFAKEIGTGKYRAVEDKKDTTHAAPPPPSRPPRQPSAPAKSPPQPRVAAQPAQPRPPSSEGRYAPARPAAIFGATQRPPQSIFSDELLSDKSLDEVILSYLAEDLEPPRRK